MVWLAQKTLLWFMMRKISTSIERSRLTLQFKNRLAARSSAKSTDILQRLSRGLVPDGRVTNQMEKFTQKIVE